MYKHSTSQDRVVAVGESKYAMRHNVNRISRKDTCILLPSKKKLNCLVKQVGVQEQDCLEIKYSSFVHCNEGACN